MGAEVIGEQKSAGGTKGGPSLGLPRSSQSSVGRTVRKLSLEPKGQKPGLASELLVLRYLQARGKSKDGWEHRTRIPGAVRPEEGERVLPKVTLMSGRHGISDWHEPVGMFTATL